MSSLNLPYSHQVSTGEQSREADRKTIEQFGVDGFTLMETAGIQAAEFIGRKTGRHSAGIFFCGKGNNGGDALAVARYLAIRENHTCHILFPAGRDNLSPDTQKNVDLLEKLASFEDVTVQFHADTDEELLLSGDYIVDGLLGTGLTSQLRPPMDEAVKLINSVKTLIFSMDIPSGLHSDSGLVMPLAVNADFTLSFGSRKLGFYLHDGPEHTGEVHQFDLTFPPPYRKSIADLLAPDIVPFLPNITRSADHKYSDNLLYVIAGSQGLTGAAIFTAASGWKSGVGAVILITPKNLIHIYEKNLPGIIKNAVGNEKDIFFSSEHSGETLEILNKKKGVLLIGPGMGREESTLTFVNEILDNFKGPAVIDADALYARNDYSKSSAPRIITPHPGEARHLSGKKLEDDLERINWAAEFAKDMSVTVVSKGSPTFVGTPRGKNYITGYDTRNFARAGFGDLLTGSIAGNIAISNDVDLSIARALLDGYLKAEEFKQQSGRPPEPNDFI